MSRLRTFLFLLLSFIAAVPCPASHVGLRVLRRTKASVITSGRRVWLPYPHADFAADVYGPQQLSVKRQNASCNLCSERQRDSSVCLMGVKELTAFVAPSGIPPGETFPATHSDTLADCRSSGLRSRINLCIRSRTPHPLAAQTLRGIRRLTRGADICGRRDVVDGFLRLMDAGQGLRLYSAGRLASGVPLSTKQLKKRERAEAQTIDDSVAIKSEAVEDKEGADERLKRVQGWRVVLHNDDIHTFECVENAITKTLPHISRARAYDIALHAHTNRKATVMLTWEEKAREIAIALQDEGLTVSIFPNKIFAEGS